MDLHGLLISEAVTGYASSFCHQSGSQKGPEKLDKRSSTDRIRVVATTAASFPSPLRLRQEPGVQARLLSFLDQYSQVQSADYPNPPHRQVELRPGAAFFRIRSPWAALSGFGESHRWPQSFGAVWALKSISGFICGTLTLCS